MHPASAAYPQARIDGIIQQIDDQVDQHEDQRDQHQVGGHHWNIGDRDGLHQQQAHPRPLKHRLGDQRERDDAAELQRVVTSQKGIEIVSAVAYEWAKFQEAYARLPNSSLERMSFVHALDVDLYFIDPGYELRAQSTHAHFADGGVFDQIYQPK